MYSFAGLLPVVLPVVMSDAGDIDQLVAFFDDEMGMGDGDSPQGGGAAEEVEDVLGDIVHSPAASSSSAALRRSGRTAENDASVPPDLPEPTMPLPESAYPAATSMMAHFNLKCELDPKKVAFALRNAEYNPRNHSSIVVRFERPSRVTALVRERGAVSIAGAYVDEEQLKHTSKKLTRLIQMVGYPDAKFAGYRVASMICKADLGFPVRLEELTTTWPRNAVYEPETYCGCVFKTIKPKNTFLITAGGKVLVLGLTTVAGAKEALRRAYPVFAQFQL